MYHVCIHTVERTTDVALTESLLQVAAASSQTDEDVADAGTEHLLRVSLREMLYQFLVHTVDVKRGNLVDKLATKDVLSPGERRRITAQKKTNVKVNCLLMTLREKTAAEFESFLTALGETGQQSVADVVRQTFHTVGQTGHNPLQIFDGEIARSISHRKQIYASVKFVC